MRKAKGLADILAKQSLRKGESFYLIERVLSYAAAIHRDEAVRELD